MESIAITSHFSLSGPLDYADLAVLKARGIDVIVNCRLENEDPNQISSQEYKKAIEAQNMRYASIPVRSLVYPKDDIARFKALVNAPQNNVHAFCRTGKRVSHLWALSQIPEKSIDRIMNECKEANVDISVIAEQLHDLAKLSK